MNKTTNKTMNKTMKRMIQLSAGALLFGAFMGSAQADNWALDHDHTRIGFGVDHMGYSTTYGYFTEYDGKVRYDRDAPDLLELEITIQTGSVMTVSKGLNDHLKNADFFNVETFPTMTFKGSGFESDDGKTGMVHGELTLLGVTKPVTLNVELFKDEVSPMTEVETIGYRAKTTLMRSEWGMSFLSPNVGEAVLITIDGELMKVD